MLTMSNLFLLQWQTVPYTLCVMSAYSQCYKQQSISVCLSALVYLSQWLINAEEQKSKQTTEHGFKLFKMD